MFWICQKKKKRKVRILTLLHNQIGRIVWNLCTFGSLKYLCCFFLVYHQVSFQNTQNIFISKGCQKKRTDNAKNFETKPTLVSCNLADILYCRQAKNRLNYYVRHYTICDMQIKQHTKSKQVHWCWWWHCGMSLN